MIQAETYSTRSLTLSPCACVVCVGIGIVGKGVGVKIEVETGSRSDCGWLVGINFTVDPTIDDNFLNITTAKGANKIWVLYHIFDN